MDAMRALEILAGIVKGFVGLSVYSFLIYNVYAGFALRRIEIPGIFRLEFAPQKLSFSAVLLLIVFVLGLTAYNLSQGLEIRRIEIPMVVSIQFGPPSTLPEPEPAPEPKPPSPPGVTRPLPPGVGILLQRVLEPPIHIRIR
jgi:hypothetical protein